MDLDDLEKKAAASKAKVLLASHMRGKVTFSMANDIDNCIRQHACAVAEVYNSYKRSTYGTFCRMEYL